MRKFGLCAAMALALAGCGGGGYPVGGPAGGGKGLPQMALGTSSGEIVPPGRSRLSALALRTFVPSGDGWQEVTGARCVVTAGDYFGGVVVTPVRVVLPDLGPDAPPVRAECTSGALAGADEVQPVYSWPAEGRPNPVTRTVWGGGWWWGYQKSGPMHYPDLAVSLR